VHSTLDRKDRTVVFGAVRSYGSTTYDVGVYNTWVAETMFKILTDFKASLAKYPPIKVGTPDPYTPPAIR
jgi:hypothetical protein